MHRFITTKLIILSLFLSACSSTSTDKETVSKKKAKIYYNQGTQELTDKSYTRALKNLIEANKLEPNNSHILNNLGMAYYFKGAEDRAERLIKKAIKLDPKNTDARINMATLYMNMSKYSKAKEQYEYILNDLTYEKQFITYFNLGILSNKENKTQQAIGYFKESVKTFENYCPSHFELGRIYLKQGTYKKALSSFKDAALGLCYNKPGPQYYQAKTLLRMGKIAQAQIKYEELNERFPESKYALLAKEDLRSLARQRAILFDQVKSQNDQRRELISPSF